MQFSMHSPIGIIHKFLSKIILRNFIASISHTNSQLFHLFYFTWIRASVEIFGFWQTRMVWFQTFVMPKINTSCDLFVADSKTVGLLSWMRDAGYSVDWADCEENDEYSQLTPHVISIYRRRYNLKTLNKCSITAMSSMLFSNLPLLSLPTTTTL